MKRLVQLCALMALSAGATPLSAAIITVNSTNNNDFSAGVTNLVLALTNAVDGDTINFAIGGAGPFYLETPAIGANGNGGYPNITQNNLTIDGYSQPGSSPNSNSLLASNNAAIKIVLDSRAGGATTNFIDGEFGTDESGVLFIVGATNVHIRGLAFLGPGIGGEVDGDPSRYAIAIGSSLPGGAVTNEATDIHISGCWFGLDPGNKTSVYRFKDGVAAFRGYSGTKFPRRITVGVAKGTTTAADARAQHNISIGQFIPLIIEGPSTRISGNRFNVFPDGNTEYNINGTDPQNVEAFIEIGRDASNLVIGTDGDGNTDAEERNLFGGATAADDNQILEWYGGNRTNMVIAGNYFGVGADGLTRYTNSMRILGGFDGTTSARFGSDFDGVSDDIEANVVFMNNPFADLFPAPETSILPLFATLTPGARASFRGNIWVNNNLVPFSYADGTGVRLNNFTNYAAPFMDTNADIIPILSTNSIYPRLTGVCAVPVAPYTNLVIDVYLVDPEGWANGKLFGLLELISPDGSFTNGFPQGRKYLGSFVDNGPKDSNPAVGQFSLDLSGLDLGTGLVTVTANYSADPPGTHNGRTHTSNFSNPVGLIPGGAISVGLTNTVPDVALWYHSTGNYVTNGPVDTAAQLAPLDNWEPYIGVMGDTTFLIGFNTFADDPTPPAGATITQGPPFQRFAVAFQPAAGGAARIGEHLFTDAGAPYRAVANYRRQNGNPQRVAGDKRSGATTFLPMSETSIGQNPAFQSDSRWTSNACYNADNAYVTVQPFSLNPATLVQTPLHKAFDPIYGNFVSANPPVTQPQVSRTGGKPEALDNGHFVVVSDDRTGYLDPDTEYTSFAIITPSGGVVKSATLVDLNDIWDNVAAYRGGFAIRVHNLLYFFDNNGNPTHTNDINASSGLTFGTGREDASRIGSDIRSYYVYLAGKTPDTGKSPVSVAIWDSRTGAFVAKATVSDTDPAVHTADRVAVAADALDRFCVTYSLQPTADFTKRQVSARVMKFDGTNITYLTHSFFAFVNYENNPGSLLGLETFHPSVAMTTRQICIAAKGQINSTNNPAAGPNTALQTQVYTVISHPDPKPTPGGVMPPPGDQLYDDPSGGWTYALNGSTATAGAANSGFTSLDGTWSHDNGSDAWDGSAIGGAFVAGSNAPGGVSSLDGYLRIEDSGDPRNAGFADPGNRKIYFGHNITTEGASATVLNDGVTLHFRARIPTAGLLDDRFITAQTNYPAAGDGYLIHDNGKGNFGIKQSSGGIISFSLATAADTPLGPGLVMNNRNGTANSADVDTGEAGTANVVTLDPTKWHEFWVTIRADTTGQGTHRVDVYLDGSLVPRTFYVTAGTGDDFTGISYIATGCGSTAQSGAFDVDYFTYKLGAVAPAGSAVPVFASASVVGANIAGSWAGGRPPYTVQAKADLSDPEWVDLVTFTNTSAAAPMTGSSGYFRVANRVVFNVSLTGANERPSPVTTPASAGGTLTLDGNKLTLDVSYSGLSGNLSGVHFHGPATAEENTNVVINLQSLNTGTTSGSVKGSVTMTAQQVKWLLNGLLYMNIHTGNNPGGEIRGQVSALQKVQFVAHLNGANERPTPITTSGQGSATLVLDNNQLKLDLNYYGLSGAPSAAHIHGPATTEQFTGVLVGIDSLGVNPPLAAAGRYSGTLTLTAAQILNLLDGLTYLNIHTGLNSSGEIRGQITP